MSRTVLLIEDNPGDARLILEMVREARDGLIHLERVDRLEPGLSRLDAGGVEAILLDLSLPDSSGLDTLRRVQSRSPSAPIVVLTGLDDETLGLEAIREGAQDYLVKGQVDSHLLVRALRYAIERKRTEESQRLLAEATRVLASSLDYEETLQSIARLIVRPLADECIIELVDSPGNSCYIVVAHRDPTKDEEVHELRRRLSSAPVGEQPVTRALQTGLPQIHLNPDSSASGPHAAADPPVLALLPREVASLIVVPLVVRDRVIGTITCVSMEPGHVFQDGDVAVVEELGHRTAIAVDHINLYRQAQEAVRLRDTVLSSVSHDLRGPLSAIKLISETLKWQVPEAAAVEGEPILEGLARIEANADRMTRQIEELVDVAHLRTGQRIKLNRRRSDLVALAHDTVADYQSRTGVHRIILEAPDSTVIGDWDAARLERVLGNLLSNAIKYSRPRTDIVVRVGSDPDAPFAVVAVQDHGLGIPSADVPRIFSWFFRAANVVDQIGGSGIGLAGAREIVELHGGTIRVQSEEGVGSTFTVRIPLNSPESE